MMATARSPVSRRGLAALALLAVFATACAAPAQSPPANDLLNAVLWMQRSVEYKASALTAFALARIRLDQALAVLDAWPGP
jgi:predicted secreted acid phosphatase